jgi:hypothetical protein
MQPSALFPQYQNAQWGMMGDPFAVHIETRRLKNKQEFFKPEPEYSHETHIISFTREQLVSFVLQAIGVLLSNGGR